MDNLTADLREIGLVILDEDDEEVAIVSLRPHQNGYVYRAQITPVYLGEMFGILGPYGATRTDDNLAYACYEFPVEVSDQFAAAAFARSIAPGHYTMSHTMHCYNVGNKLGDDTFAICERDPVSPEVTIETGSRNRIKLKAYVKKLEASGLLTHQRIHPDQDVRVTLTDAAAQDRGATFRQLAVMFAQINASIM